MRRSVHRIAMISTTRSAFSISSGLNVMAVADEQEQQRNE